MVGSEWLYKAAEVGFAKAHLTLGQYLITGEHRFVKDLRMAVAHFTEAVRQNLFEGLVELGYCRQKGLGIAIDADEAAVLFKRAAALKNKAAVDGWRKKDEDRRLGLVDGQPFSCFNKECSICTNRLVPGQAILRLDCCHGFHTTCLEPWLEEHHTCPICRGDARRRVRGIAF